MRSQKRSTAPKVFLFVRLLLLALAVLTAPMLARPVQAKVKLNKTSLVLPEGGSYQLKISGTSKRVSWKSSDKKVATVSSKGKVQAKKEGTAKITAKVDGKKYTCKVTVYTKKAYQAYLLREYILKKGKKSGDERYIRFSDTDEEESDLKYEIAATKDKYGKSLFFRFSLMPDTASYSRSIELSLDLLGDKKGAFRFRRIDEADDTGFAITGSARLRSNGVHIYPEKAEAYDTNEDYDIVSIDQPIEEYASWKSTILDELSDTYKGFDDLMKKAGLKVTMDSMGF